MLRELAGTLRAQNRLAEEEPLRRKISSAWRKKLPAWPQDYVSASSSLGVVLTGLNRASEAEPFLVEALAICRTTGLTAGAPPLPSRIAASARLLGNCLTDQGRYVQAEPLLLEAYELNKKSRDRSTSRRTALAARRLERKDIDPIVTLYGAGASPGRPPHGGSSRSTPSFRTIRSSADGNGETT